MKKEDYDDRKKREHTDKNKCIRSGRELDSEK